MSMHEKTSTSETVERELVISRVFDAPRELVFKVWTEPEHIARWWGPKGFTTPHCTIDLSPGGVFHYCMRSPEGRDYWGRGVFKEIVEPERLIYIDTFADAEGNMLEPEAIEGMDPDWPREALVTVTFTEQDGQTVVTVRHGVPISVGKRSGAQQGWTEMLDRLAAYLAQDRAAGN